MESESLRRLPAASWERTAVTAQTGESIEGLACRAESHVSERIADQEFMAQTHGLLGDEEMPVAVIPTRGVLFVTRNADDAAL